jgi:hypothetical protein
MFLSRILILVTLLLSFTQSFSQQKIIYRDSVVYRISYRDTMIYKYDTVKIRLYVQSDTIWNSKGPNPVPAKAPKAKFFNPNAWGIGPTVGAYYSPFNGFDINLGFGVQYYLFAVPSFRKPHMKIKKHGK